MLKLKNVLLAEPILFAVLVQAQAGLLGQEPRLDGPLLVEECRPGRGFGQSDASQPRFLHDPTAAKEREIIII